MCGGGGIGDVGFEFSERGAEFAVLNLADRYGGTASIALDGIGVSKVIVLGLGGRAFLVCDG